MGVIFLKGRGEQVVVFTKKKLKKGVDKLGGREGGVFI